MFNNSKGKTSLTLVCAFLVIVTGCGGFIYGAAKLDGNTMIQAIAMVTIGSGLLGIRRFTQDKELNPDATKET